jgi:outer membrane protein
VLNRVRGAARENDRSDGLDWPLLDFTIPVDENDKLESLMMSRLSRAVLNEGGRRSNDLRRDRVRAVVAALVMSMSVAGAVAGQTQSTPAPPAQPLTLDQAVEYAVAHYPTIRAALERVNVSDAGVDVARSAYLPRLDSLWQSNRATANNIFGQLLPQSVIPALTGPVLPAASSDSVWGSAVGALFAWEPFDFGLRGAGVRSAEAALARARAGEALTRLDVQTAVARAFLVVAATKRAVTAAQADVDRRDTLRRTIHTLVDNQLRPGAEASRADAERAAAETRLIQAKQRAALAETAFMRVLGLPSGSVAIAGDALIARLPGAEVPAAGASAHPLAQVHRAAVAEARASEALLARTDLPRVYLQSSVFARGSGAAPSGALDGGADGLELARANWAAGVQVVFPNVFDFASLRARKAAASASTRVEAALYDEAQLTVTSQQQEAAALLEAARAVAANTPVQLAAAQQSESQARARYDAGLTSIVEVADAQSLLAQAELQDQLARVEVWDALLATAAAQGDLSPFLALVREP